MTAATPSRLGQVNLSGDVEALFLDVFGGEVLAAFETKVQMRDKHMVRQIEHGRSARFPATFKVGTAYHTPGAEIVGQTVRHNEVTISIDDILVSDVFVANIDELQNHYDVRSIYSTEMGNALALAYDRNVTRNLLRAARGAELFPGDGGGAIITNAGFATTATTLFDGISQAKQTMEEKDVPVDSMSVYAAFRPALWYLMARSDRALNKDFNDGGTLGKSVLETVDGTTIIKSTALPFGTNDSSNTALPSGYRINMTNTSGVVWTPMAAATLQLMDVQMESEYDIRRQGTLMLGKYLVGHGPLRSKCAVELRTAAN
jgi:hypothetical protein